MFLEQNGIIIPCVSIYYQINIALAFYMEAYDIMYVFTVSFKIHGRNLLPYISNIKLQRVHVHKPPCELICFAMEL